MRAGALLDEAVAHDGDAVGHGEGLELVVGHDHRRLVETGQHLLDLPAHLLAQLDVEAGERLIEQEAAGIAHDRAADGDALAFAFGQLPRPAIEHIVEMEGRADPAHARGDLGRGHPFGVQRIGQILGYGQRGVERIELKHHGDVAIARRQVIDAPAGDVDVASARVFEAGDHAQRRGLAAAGRAEQTDDLAGRDIEVDPVDGGEIAENLGHLLERDRRHQVTV